jgi:hypothetical protein
MRSMCMSGWVALLSTVQWGCSSSPPINDIDSALDKGPVVDKRGPTIDASIVDKGGPGIDGSVDAPAPVQCGPSWCKGCCDSVGKCFAGTSTTSCGTGGAACKACASGSTCQAGQCVAGSCGPGNCPGCCQGNQCLQGTSDSACGTVGISCVTCGADQGCVNGACSTKPSCDATSCPNGCCWNGACVPGTSTVLCGKGGVPCDSCMQGHKCLNQSCT